MDYHSKVLEFRDVLDETKRSMLELKDAHDVRLAKTEAAMDALKARRVHATQHNNAMQHDTHGAH